MRRGRDERDAGDGVARLGDDVVHLEAGQLSALAGLGALGHLDLYLFGVHQIFCRHAEAAAGDLLGLARKADAVHLRVVAGIVFAALARVGPCAQLVHGQGQSFVGLNAECAERHGAGHKVLHDGLHRLHLVDGGRSRCLLPAEEVTDENGGFFLIYQGSPLLKLFVAAQAGGQLQLRDGLRIPGVPDAVLSPRELTVVGE